MKAERDETLSLVEVDRGDSLGLIEYDDALPPHFFNGPKLMSGGSWQDAGPASVGLPGRVNLAPWSPLFEPQRVELAFSRVPDEALASALREEITEAMEAAARA